MPKVFKDNFVVRQRYKKFLLRRYFTEHPLPHGEAQLEALIAGCFHHGTCNHLFYEDDERLFAESSFTDYFIEPSCRTAVPDAALQEKLCTRYPGYTKFDCSGMNIFAVKH
ncbi:MAG: hypothetical protein LBT89_00255 [Planctomycetaceae bacterium]|nr:hypothetical protein [Planctomycetaceae bacterium]